ncbi:MAG TPA: hypothetical protein DCG06_15870 [Deltaproteobacteria bacterium]|nr:hypothetical protein [Deltaproteobacteria bacterium]
MAADDNHRQVRVVTLHSFQQGQSINLRKPNVKDYQIGHISIQQLEGSATIAGLDNGISFIRQDSAETQTDLFFIINDQNLFTHGSFLLPDLA